MQSELYSVREVAEIAKVCDQTVRNWIRGIFCDKGKTKAYRKMEPLKAIKIGGTYRVYASDLNRFLEAARC